MFTILIFILGVYLGSKFEPALAMENSHLYFKYTTSTPQVKKLF